MLVKLNVDNHITGKEDELKGHLNGIFRLMSTTLKYKECHLYIPHRVSKETRPVLVNTRCQEKHTWTQETNEYLKEKII